MKQFVVYFKASSLFFLQNHINDFLETNKDIKLISITQIYNTNMINLIKRHEDYQVLICFERIDNPLEN